MLATTSNWKDVQKYYQGTFIKLRELGDEVVRVDKVEPTSMWVVLQSNEKIELVLSDEGYNLDYQIPKKTVYQNGQFAYVLDRIPARMWKKGLSSENTTLNAVEADGVLEQVHVNKFENLFSFVNKPEYVKLFNYEVYASAALSNRIYVTKNGVIWCDAKAIGKVVEKTVYCYPMFKSNLARLVEGFTIVEV